MASLRAREKAELASARSIARQSARERTAAIKQEVRSRAQEIVRGAREEARIRREGAREGARLGREAGRLKAKFEIEGNEQTREFRRGLLGGAASRVMGTVGAVGRMGATAVGVTGSALAASSVSQALRLDESTRRLSIAGRMPGQTGADPEGLRRQFTNLGVETGINPEQIAAGASKFVAKTGDLTTAMANMRNFAITAQATGASIDDIASAGADLAEKFNIKSAEDMAQALSVLAFQGKKGAFELKDMAEQFPEMAAAASRAGMTGVGGMRTLGGLAQIARQSTGSGSEASTALQMMLTQLVTKSDKLASGEALGGQKVDVFEGGDPTKKARDIPTILAEIISKSHGNQQQMAKLFDIRGTRAVSPLVKVYRDAAEGHQGSAADKELAGKQAVLGYIEQKSESGAGWKDVQEDAASAMKSTSVQIDILRTKLEAAVASALFPAFMRLVPEIERLVPYVEQAANFFVALITALAQNPIAGIGSVITAGIMKDLASAGLGTAAKLAVEGALSKWAVGAGILGLMVGAFEVGQMMVATMQVASQQKVDAFVKTGDAVRAQAMKELTETGRLTPETRMAMDEVNMADARVRGASNAIAEEGFSDTVGRAWNSMMGRDTGTLQEKMDVQTAVGSKDFTEAYVQNQKILDLDEMSKRLTNGAEEVKAIMVAGATEAATALKDGAKEAAPNRGDAPTGDLKNKK